MRVALESLGHAYAGSAWLFRSIDVEFRPGCSYAITGASGSGKSTLMAIIAGWIVPTEGRVVRDAVHTTSWVLQNPFGVPRRSAIDHVAYPFLARGASAAQAEERAARLLHEFELTDVAERPFRHLSGGEAQRLMLARAAAVAPELLLVDEPTAQLDRATAHRVNKVLARAVSEGTIVLVATHDDETRAACDEHLDLTAFADDTRTVGDAPASVPA